RVADPGRDHPRHAARWHGDGQSNFLGMVHRGDLRHRHRLRRPADRDLGSWDVRSVRAMSYANPQSAPQLTADPLFVGATRPPMRWGVTYAALLFNLVFTLEIFLLTKNLLTLLSCLPVHGVFALLCARDARFFDLVLLWGRTRLPAALRNLRLWQAS